MRGKPMERVGFAVDEFMMIAPLIRVDGVQ
jgi:hypothetical protein